jgi:hypothetical protein
MTRAHVAGRGGSATVPNRQPVVPLQRADAITAL